MTTPHGNNEKRRCPRCNTGTTSDAGVWLGPVVYMECDACGFTTMAEHPHREAVRDLANALQVALCVSARLESHDTIRGNDLRPLQNALRRAVAALDTLRGQ